METAALISLLDGLAPFQLAEAGDNCGLLLGDPASQVRRVLVTLEVSEPVLKEAVAGGFDTILSHHPLFFVPVRSLVESVPRERLLRDLVKSGVAVIACHTNLDSAEGGLADIAAEALRLRDVVPLEPAPAGWHKLVGLIPAGAVEEVAAAVFAAGAGTIGGYSECAYATEGSGWFTPGPGTDPAVGGVGAAERVPEVRWETVVPEAKIGAATRAFVVAHPYEEPAFDVYPLGDVLPGVGLGRVGSLAAPVPVARLAEQMAEIVGVGSISWTGDDSRMVRLIGVLPGSGRSGLEGAVGRCEVLVTGDLGHHDADRAAEGNLSLVSVPHGEFEWWALRRWAATFAEHLSPLGVEVGVSGTYELPWKHVSMGCCDGEGAGGARGKQPVDPTDGEVPMGHVRGSGDGEHGLAVRMWIDGGSRGNPGPSAIGVLIEDLEGRELLATAEVIGVATNNVAEYRALLSGLSSAEALGAGRVEVFSDSELLVRQLLGEYKVKNEGLKPLHAEARERARSFGGFSIHHVEREANSRADRLVNRALDEEEAAGL